MVSSFPQNELNNFNRNATEKKNISSKMNFHQATDKWVKIERVRTREREHNINLKNPIVICFRIYELSSTTIRIRTQ